MDFDFGIRNQRSAGQQLGDLANLLTRNPRVQSPLAPETPIGAPSTGGFFPASGGGNAAVGTGFSGQVADATPQGAGMRAAIQDAQLPQGEPAAVEPRGSRWRAVEGGANPFAEINNRLGGQRSIADVARDLLGGHEAIAPAPAEAAVAGRAAEVAAKGPNLIQRGLDVTHNIPLGELLAGLNPERAPRNVGRQVNTALGAAAATGVGHSKLMGRIMGTNAGSATELMGSAAEHARGALGGILHGPLDSASIFGRLAKSGPELLGEAARVIK
jgi:hypothetical protein